MARKLLNQKLEIEVEKKIDSFTGEKEVFQSALKEIKKEALDLCSVSKEELDTVIIP